MRPSDLLRLAVCLLVCLPVLAQSKPPERAVTCANCHQEEGTSQPATQMGQALMLPGSNSVLDTHPKMAFRTGQFSYSVETRQGKSFYNVSDGAQTISAPILWALGAQAQTWVLLRDGKMYESLVSFYPSIDGLDFTTGDEHIDPKTLDQAFGRPMSGEEAKSCFGCHSTGAVVDHKLNLASLQPGLTCEHCHQGASAHLASIVKGDLSTMPRKLGQLSAEDTSNFCGQCHRSWETVVRSHWRGPANVRFQPYRLANSKCFNGADARIRCTSCHDPHQKVVHRSSYYDAKCLACHAPLLPNVPTSGTTASATLEPVSAAPSSTTAAAVTPAHGKVCPVAKANCSSCHMPKVTLPSGRLEFSDHDIRVIKPGEPYPN